VALFEDLMDSNSLFLTGNTDTVYASGILDLDRDGPTVVEIPPRCGPGTVNDAWFRFVIDMVALVLIGARVASISSFPPDMPTRSLTATSWPNHRPTSSGSSCEGCSSMAGLTSPPPTSGKGCASTH
jgi:hypothetical protein